MIPVEEAIRAQRLAGLSLLDKSDRACGPDTMKTATIVGANLLRAPLYTWTRPIKRLVDQAAMSYPVGDAVESMHFFHQPSMFWLFDEPIFWLTLPGEREASGIDAVLLSPWADRERLEQLPKIPLRASATGEPPEALNGRETALATGMGIIAMTSVRTSAPVHLRGEHFPSGSRLLLAALSKPIRFRGRPDAHGIHGKEDPILAGELTALARWVLAACALLKQRILQVVPDRGTHAERKRLERESSPRR